VPQLADDFRGRVLRDAIRDRAVRPTAPYEWADQIEVIARNLERHADSETPFGIFEGRVYPAAWPALRDKFRIAACAYRELLADDDVKALGI